MPRSEEDPDAHEIRGGTQVDAELVMTQHDPLPKGFTGEVGAARRSRVRRASRAESKGVVYDDDLFNLFRTIAGQDVGIKH